MNRTFPVGFKRVATIVEHAHHSTLQMEISSVNGRNVVTEPFPYPRAVDSKARVDKGSTSPRLEEHCGKLKSNRQASPRCLRICVGLDYRGCGSRPRLAPEKGARQSRCIPLSMIGSSYLPKRQGFEDKYDVQVSGHVRYAGTTMYPICRSVGKIYRSSLPDR